MLTLLRRHWILSVFTLLAIALVLIGWWLRPVNTPSGLPADAPTISPESGLPVEPDVAAARSPEAVIPEEVNCADTFNSLMDRSTDPDHEARTAAVVEQALMAVETAATPGQIVFASHLSKESPSKRIRLLTDGVNAAPGSPHLLWTAVSTCLFATGGVFCPDLDRWTERLLAIDGENALAWSLSAHVHLEAGRDADALAALQRASISYTVNDYWIDDIKSALAAVTSHGGYSENLAAVQAIGFAAAFASPLSYYFVCQKQAGASAEWADACLALGKTIEAGATVYMTKSFGRSIQRIARIAAGEDPDSEELKALRAMLLPENAGNEALRYPDSPKIFMQTMLAVGEIEAYRIMSEINRKRRAAGYQANCDVIRLDY